PAARPGPVKSVLRLYNRAVATPDPGREPAMPTLTTDARAWRADTIDDPRDWYYPLSAAGLAALREAARAGAGRPAVELRAGADPRAAGAADLGRGARAVEDGRGFAVVSAPHEESPALYWLVGQLLGEPLAQNVQGVLLYDVRDTGQEVAQGARFSVTSYES